MPGRMPPPINPTPRHLPSVQRKLFRQQRLLMQLTAYRPLAVLAGIWIGLLAIALLAYSQLMQTPANQAETVDPAAPDLYPHERVYGTTANQSPLIAPETTDPDGSTTSDTTDAAMDTATVNGLSGWTLLALVGGCAGGCWVLSVLIKMPRRPKKPRSQRRSAARPKYRLANRDRRPTKSPAAATPQQQLQGVPKLDAYDPSQPLVAPAQRSSPTAPPSSRPPASMPTAEAEVTVVSDQVQHQLDWPSDSLVNTADVRQRRSLSSFM